MGYKHITSETFIERPNRFITYCDIDGFTTKVHIRTPVNTVSS